MVLKAMYNRIFTKMPEAVAYKKKRFCKIAQLFIVRVLWPEKTERIERIIFTEKANIPITS